MDFLFFIQGVSVIQFLVVGIFLLTNKKGNRVSNALLAVFLISKAICFAGEILMLHGQVSNIFPFLYILTASVDLLLGPSLYLYILSLMYKDFRIKRYHLLHLLPIILFIIIFALAFITYPGPGINLIYSHPPLVTILISTTYLHFIVYSVICLFSLKNFEKKLKIEFSSIDKIKMSWLFFLVIGFISIWGSAYINYMGEVFNIATLIPWQIFIILVFIFANIIVYKGLKQPELFAGILISSENNIVRKYAKTALPEQKKDELLEQILCFMKSSKPYLNPSLTLDEFSEKISLPARHISQILNSNLNQNFYDFINSYRVEESKISLKDKPDDTILQILFDSGFNSKASFNRAFKKNTGMTPSEYKKNYCIS